MVNWVIVDNDLLLELLHIRKVHVTAKDLVEKLEKNRIFVEELKVVDGPNTRRGWVEEMINETTSLDT